LADETRPAGVPIPKFALILRHARSRTSESNLQPACERRDPAFTGAERRASRRDYGITARREKDVWGPDIFSLDELHCIRPGATSISILAEGPRPSGAIRAAEVSKVPGSRFAAAKRCGSPFDLTIRQHPVIDVASARVAPTRHIPMGHIR